MNNHLYIPTKLEDDIDGLSTHTDNSSHMGAGDNSPNFNTRMSEDADTCSISSKKIRKKRNAYQKIDDDIRVQLLEAVQRGETLKAASKRFKINYSSAKSILHTYRKEGRILKKSGQEKNFLLDGMQQAEPAPVANPMFANTNMKLNFPLAQMFFNKLDNTKIEATNTNNSPKVNMNTVPLSPSNGLADSFGSLLKLNSANNASNDFTRMDPSANLFAKFTPKLIHPTAMMQTGYCPMTQPPNLLGINMSPVNAASFPHMLQTNPLEKLKYMDNNFYMNYSNSPLSGGGQLVSDSTDSSKHNSSRARQLEFESFSEMVNALQNQPRQADDLLVPHALRMNTTQLLQDKIDGKLTNTNNSMEWDGSIENAAIDTFKSFMDAQLLLHDALKKANYLNNLVQYQKSKTDGSPVFGQLQGLKFN